MNFRLTRRREDASGPTEMAFDVAAAVVAQVIGKRRTFIAAPIQFHYLLARIAEATMTVPLVSVGQVRILEEGVVESTRAPDPVPADLVPSTPFDAESVRADVPMSGRFGLRDLRMFARHRRDPMQRVSVCGEGTAIIKRSPKDILEFVLDVHQYRRADLKIGRVRWMQRDGDTGHVRHGGRFMRLSAPAVTLSFELTPYSRINFVGVRMPWPLRGFSGFFTCSESSEGTLVTHRECFELGPVIGPMFKAVFGGWLSRDTAAEVARMKQILNREQ